MPGKGRSLQAARSLTAGAATRAQHVSIRNSIPFRPTNTFSRYLNMLSRFGGFCFCCASRGFRVKQANPKGGRPILQPCTNVGAPSLNCSWIQGRESDILFCREDAKDADAFSESVTGEVGRRTILRFHPSSTKRSKDGAPAGMVERTMTKKGGPPASYNWPTTTLRVALFRLVTRSRYMVGLFEAANVSCLTLNADCKANT